MRQALIAIFGLATAAGGLLEPIHEPRPDTPGHVEMNH